MRPNVNIGEYPVGPFSMSSFQLNPLIPRACALYKVSKTPTITFRLDTTPEFCTRGTRHFLRTHPNAPKQPRDPHDARTTQRDAHQRADLAEYVRIEPKIMRWRPERSAQWPRQRKHQCKADPQHRHEISGHP